MTVFNNQNFISFDGSPITGRTPTKTIIMADEGFEMSPQLRGAVAHAYKTFCDAVNVSAFPNGYHLQNRNFPDGSKVRMESNNGVHQVMVWPVGGDKEKETWAFFCIPFDETYPTHKDNRTYWIKKWKDANAASPETILDGLKSLDPAKHFQFPSSTEEDKKKFSHPGNQTWFAKLPNDEKHKNEGVVLSWWGQAKRYASSSLDMDAYNLRVWNRMQQTSGLWWETLGSTSAADADRPPQGMFQPNQYGDEISKPPSGDAKKCLWINGLRIRTPYEIISACLANRGGTKIRIVTEQGFKFPYKVYETSLKGAIKSALSSGEVLADRWTEYSLPTFQSTLGFSICESQIQPPYWNADGTEAIGIIAVVYPAGTFRTGSIAYKLRQSESGIDTELFEASTCNFIRTKSGTDVPGGSHPSLSMSGVSDSETDTSSNVSSLNISIDAVRVIAADYAGNTLRALRSHYSEMTIGSMNHATNDAANYTVSPISVTLVDILIDGTVINTAHTYNSAAGSNASHSLSLNSSMSCTRSGELTLNGTRVFIREQVFSNSDTRSESSSTSVTSDTMTTYWVPQTPPSGYTGRHYTRGTAYSHSATYNQTMSLSGSCCDPCFVGGDLRGNFVLIYETPVQSECEQVGVGINSLPHGINPDFSYQESSCSFSYSRTCSGTTSGLYDTNPALWSASDQINNETQSVTVSGSGESSVCPHVGDLLLVNLTTLETEVIASYACDYPFMYVNENSAYGFFIPPGSYETTNTQGTDIYRFFSGGGGMYSNVGGLKAIGSNIYTSGGAGDPLIDIAGLGKHAYKWTDRYYTDSVAEVNTSLSTIWGFNSSAGTIISPDSKTVYTMFGPDDTVRFSGGYTGAFHSTSLSPDLKAQYIGFVPPKTITPASAKTVVQPEILDQWFVLGEKVTPTQEYPYTGDYKMLSSPIFCGVITLPDGQRFP